MALPILYRALQAGALGWAGGRGWGAARSRRLKWVPHGAGGRPRQRAGRGAAVVARSSRIASSCPRLPRPPGTFRAGARGTLWGRAALREACCGAPGGAGVRELLAKGLQNCEHTVLPGGSCLSRPDDWACSPPPRLASPRYALAAAQEYNAQVLVLVSTGSAEVHAMLNDALPPRVGRPRAAGWWCQGGGLQGCKWLGWAGRVEGEVLRQQSLRAAGDLGPKQRCWRPPPR
jgi:hypothetical protein